MESGVQFRASKLFSAFFNRKTIALEIMDKCENFINEDVKQFVLLLQTEADILNVSFLQHATQFTSTAIFHLIESYDYNKVSFPFKFLAAVISELSKNKKIHVAEIEKIITNHSALLPPQLLVELEKNAVISLLYYFQNSMENNEKSSSWVHNLSKLACDQSISSTKCDTIDIFHQLFAVVVEVGFGTSYPEAKIESQVLKKSLLVITNVIKKIWDHANAHTDKEVWMVLQIPISSSLSPHFHLSSFQKCYLEQLTFLIRYQPEIKASKAISCQHEWTFFKSPKNIVEFFTQLLIPLEVESMLDKIEEIISRYEINWKTLLLVISVTQICFPSGNRLVRALISSLLQQSLDKFQTDLLLAAFLLARQINAESASGAHYGTWFSSITSSSTTSKQFAFLMKFLTSIVRHEPLWVLNAHKGTHPHIPLVDNCRALWTDYTVLVRTRIEDLKGKSSTDQIIEEDSGLIKEVESAVAAYEKSGRIPNSVVEAAIFSKPYFINKFLPALLKPRRVPIRSDVREDFINVLRQSGKLPLNMYETYVTSCKQSGQTHIDCDFSKVSKDPAEFFSRIVRCKEPSQNSALLNKMAGMLEGLVTPLNVSVIDFDLENICDSASLKIVDLWIENFIIGLSENDQTDWRNGYFLLLCPHPSLLGSLYCRIREFISHCKGSEIEIKGYGSIISLIYRNGHILLPIRHKSFTGEFVNYLCEVMDLTRSQSMLFLQRVLHHVVGEAKSRGELDQVSKMLQLYRWLTRRASYSQKRDPLFIFLPIESALMEINDWLHLEISVQSSQDLLEWHERISYLQTILDTDYPNESSNLSRTILSALVRHVISIKESFHPDCSQDLLQLLQSRMTEESSKGKPWLIQYWLELRQEHGSHVDQILWSLICSLPAHLLRSNREDQSEFHLKDMTTLIEDYWRNTLMDGAWFPKHVTCHILRALEGSSELIPCLQFSKQIHSVYDEIKPFGKWSALSDALKIFHPKFSNTELSTSILWSGSFEVDSLVCQLMLLTAALGFSRDCSLEWPWFVMELGASITRNPRLLVGCKMISWTSSRAILPWGKVLPNYIIRLLPIVLLQLLVSWSDGLLKTDLSTAVDYLETLLAAHTNWIEITNAFVESLATCGSRFDYPAGALFDLSSLGKVNRDIQQILCRAPLRAIKTLQQDYSNFQQLDPDFQSIIKQRMI